MTVAEKLELIILYRQGVEKVEERLKGLPSVAIDFLPPLAGAWSIRAHIAHLLDADFFGWARIRKSVAQPGAIVDVWDQEAWAERLDYRRLNLPVILDMIRSIRGAMADFLGTIVELDWTAYTMNHPERGITNLETTVALYNGHIDFHLKYIDRNIAAFASEPRK